MAKLLGYVEKKDGSGRKVIYLGREGCKNVVGMMTDYKVLSIEQSKNITPDMVGKDIQFNNSFTIS